MLVGFQFSIDLEDIWVCWLHSSAWTIWIFYKLRVFSSLVIYEGLLSKAKLAKSGLSDGLFPVC